MEESPVEDSDITSAAREIRVASFIRVVESSEQLFGHAHAIPAMDVDSETEASGHLLHILNSIKRRRRRAGKASANCSSGKGASNSTGKASGNNCTTRRGASKALGKAIGNNSTTGKRASRATGHKISTGKENASRKKPDDFQMAWKEEIKNIDKIVRDYLEALKDLGRNHTGFVKLSDEMFRLLMGMMREHQRRPQHELRDWCMSVIIHLRRSYVHAGSMEDDLAMCMECACTKLASIKDLYYSDSEHRKRDLLIAIKKLDTILRELCFGITDYKRLKGHYLGLKNRVLSRLRPN